MDIVQFAVAIVAAFVGAVVYELASRQGARGSVCFGAGLLLFALIVLAGPAALAL